MMGIYLLSVASHDILYRDQYNRYALQWTDSWSCQLTGMLAMVSCEVSVFILVTVSVDCCLAVIQPYRRPLLTTGRAVGALVIIWSAGLGLATLPMAFDDRFYSGNGVCMPLHIHGALTSGWQYSAAVFLGLNSVAIMLITISYVTIATSVRRTRLASYGDASVDGGGTGSVSGMVARSSSHVSAEQDRNMAKRFFVIVLTDMLCWVPIIVTKSLALADVYIPGMY